MIFNCVVYVPVTYNEYVYPRWAEAIGWGTCVASLICIPIFMVVKIYLKVGSWSVSSFKHHFLTVDKTGLYH